MANFKRYMLWKQYFFGLPEDVQVKIANKLLARNDKGIYLFDEENMNKHFTSPYHAAVSLIVNDRFDEYYLLDCDGEGFTFPKEELRDHLLDYLDQIYEDEKLWTDEFNTYFKTWQTDAQFA